jgi:hypothetical protein
VFGLNQLVEGNLDDPLVLQAAQTRLVSFLDGASTIRPTPEGSTTCAFHVTSMLITMARPSAIRVRPADTELIVEVERDYTVYGDEVKFAAVR